MAYGMTPAFATLILSALNGVRPRVPIVCAQLHDGPPGVGSSNLSGIGARQEISLTAPDSGTVALTGVFPSWEVTDTETVAAVSLWSGFDGDPDAMCLFTLAADPPVVVADGDVLVLNTCELQWAPAAQGLWVPGTNVAAPTAGAAASMLAPSLRIGQSLTVPVMRAAAVMLAPRVFEGVVAQPPTMAAHASMLTPTLAAGATLTAPTAEASAHMLTPTLVTSVSASVDAPTMHATAVMLPPSFGGSAVIPVMTAQARATELAPTVSASARIAAPAAAAAAQMRVPSAAGPTFTPFTETNVEHTNQAVPAGCNGCWVTANGGGAAGQNGVGNHQASGMGGGGSGARIDRVWIPRSLLGTTYSTGYGRGGATAAAAGGDTFFRSGNVNLTAGGGQPGSGATGGAGGTPTAAGVTGVVTHPGCAGGTGTTAGGGAGASDTVNEVGGGGGAGGSGNSGGGGAGGNSPSAAGGAASTGGGSVGGSGQPGADAAAGHDAGGGGSGGGVGIVFFGSGQGGPGGKGGKAGAGGGSGGNGNSNGGVGGAFAPGSDGHLLVEWQ